MIRHGVEGAEDIPLDVGYLMRRYDQDGIVRLRQQFDDKEVVRLIEGAIRAGDAGMPKDRIAKIAKGVYKTLRQRHLGDPALTRPLTAADFDKAVKDLVDNMGMTHADAEDVVSVVHSFVKDGDPASGAMPRHCNDVHASQVRRRQIGHGSLVSGDDRLEQRGQPAILLG